MNSPMIRIRFHRRPGESQVTYSVDHVWQSDGEDRDTVNGIAPPTIPYQLASTPTPITLGEVTASDFQSELTQLKTEADAFANQVRLWRARVAASRVECDTLGTPEDYDA